MTIGLAFLLKSTLFWVGLAALGRAAWLAVFRRGLGAAIFATICLAGSAVLPGREAGFSLPMALPILPAEYWLALPLTGFAITNLAQLFFSNTGTERSRAIKRFAFFLAFAFLFGWLGRHSPTKIEIETGEVHSSVEQLLAAVALGVLSVAGMALAMKGAKSRLAARGVATYLGLVTGAVVFGLPMAWMLSTSFRENSEINSGEGIRWVPIVQRQALYSDPQNPYYGTVAGGANVEGHIIATRPDGRLVLEIQRPLSRIGQTEIVDRAQLREKPESKPMVTFQTPSGPREGIDLETTSDGRHRIHVLGQAINCDLVTDAAKVRPLREQGIRFQNYADALEFLPPETLHGLVYLRNTLILVILSVLGAVLSSSIVAYAFARLRFPGRKFMFALLVSTMMLPSVVTLMPQFMIFRELGWVDTFKPLWVPAFLAAPFNVFMLRQFFAGIPKELEEAAVLDGCSIPKVFWSVCLPQIVPALVTVAIWTAVGAWNNFTGPLIYISSPEKMPISYAVQLFQGQRSNEPALLMAFVTMSIIPVVLLFLFAQRYFVQSASTSGLAGR